jgi:hypothetical protein
MPIAARCFLGCLILASVVVFLSKPATGIGHWARTSCRTDIESPRAVVDSTEWNFGRVPIGHDLRATFIVKNNGTRRLILAEQGECCGSANVEIIVPSGMTQELTFPIRTNQRQLGPHREVVCYETNDRLQPTLAFTVVFDLTDGQATVGR